MVWPDPDRASSWGKRVMEFPWERDIQKPGFLKKPGFWIGKPWPVESNGAAAMLRRQADNHHFTVQGRESVA